MNPNLWIWMGVSLVVLLGVTLRTTYIVRKYGPPIRRIFEESPMFVPPEGSERPAAEEVEFHTADGLTLRGSYWRSGSGLRRGVIVFCHEFLSDRWSGVPYWEHLHRDGFDVFGFDFRNHGASDKSSAYVPRHWVTEFEVADLSAAIDYLAGDSRSAGLPIGVFGISRGGGAGLAAAARRAEIRCVVSDGAFGTHGTMLTYMNKWMTLVVGDKWYYKILPNWYLGFIRDRVLAGVERDYGCRFVRLERAIRRVAPRPILMIHGGRDGYIRPDIARALYECAGEPREFWVVAGARHNACLETAGEEYRRRVSEFFVAHLGGGPAAASSALGS